MGLYEFKASLVYRESFRTASATQRNPVSKTKREKERKKKTCNSRLAFLWYEVSAGLWMMPLGVLHSNLKPFCTYLYLNANLFLLKISPL